MEVLGQFCALAAPHSPFSSTCDFPALVEATTAAVAWVTPREACWSLHRLVLSLSAFTCRTAMGGHLDPRRASRRPPHGLGQLRVSRSTAGEQPRCCLRDGAAPRAGCGQQQRSTRVANWAKDLTVTPARKLILD